MPSSPKIQKELILETALKQLIRDGYSSITIKTVAEELGCSTQPISRQFGNMDGFRKELLDYCMTYLHNIFQLKGEKTQDIVIWIAKSYVELAYDYPNLYKYLYMSDQEGEKIGVLAGWLREPHYSTVMEMLAKEHGISVRHANQYMKNLSFYVHGIASYIAVDFMDASKQEVMDRIRSASEAFLEQAKKECSE